MTLYVSLYKIDCRLLTSPLFSFSSFLPIYPDFDIPFFILFVTISKIYNNTSMLSAVLLLFRSFLNKICVFICCTWVAYDIMCTQASRLHSYVSIIPYRSNIKLVNIQAIRYKRYKKPTDGVPALG